jgi:regulator of cell morphogenesis and NO signaling
VTGQTPWQDFQEVPVIRTASDAETTLGTTLGALVSEAPDRAPVFDRLGLDYCCHGDRTLAEACGAQGLDVDVVVDALARTRTDPAAAVWTTLGPAALADHVVEVHHRYLWDELGPLEELATKVDGVHGGRHAELHEVAALVRELRAELEPHMEKEERVLFPAIHALADGKRAFAFGSIDDPIRMMRVEHERAGEILDRLHEISDGFRAPDDGCASYRSLYRRLAGLETDTHLHVHKENGVLFPAAAALAAQ